MKEKIPAKKVYTQSYIKEKFVKKRTYTITTLLLLLGCAGSFFTGYYVSSPEGMPFLRNKENGYLDFQVSVIITENPVDIIFNITNIQSSSDIIDSEYCIDHIHNWTNFQITGNQATIIVEHHLYYDLLNVNNNSVRVFIENTELSLEKTASFSL